MCPDPALLVAHLDGTLASRDAAEIDRHTAGCERCAATLASMRYQRALARPVSRWRPRRVAAAAGVVIVVGALGAWLVLSGRRGEPAGESVGRTDSETATADGGPEVGAVGGRLSATLPADTVPSGALSSDERVSDAAEPAPPTLPGVSPSARGADVTGARPAPAEDVRDEGRASGPAAAAPVDVPSVPDPSGRGILLRRGPGARVVWRVLDRTIERSTDGGASWTVEQTADRPVRAGTVVSGDVAWLVGEEGLVLRRTANGWFGTNPPGDVHVDAVRASGPALATVTLADGRVLRTENGGVTWFDP